MLAAIYFLPIQIRVVLPRQIRLKEEEDWVAGLHHAVYPLSWFDIPHDCTNSHIMLHPSDDFKLCTLPEISIELL